VAYDYLVIASGATSKAPVEPPHGIDSKQFFDDVHQKIGAAKNILIMGGGPVGCELAGEIKCKFQDKTVTVVNRGKILCKEHWLTEANSKKIEGVMNKMGIKTILGDTVVFNDTIRESDTFTTGPVNVSLSSGMNISGVDLVINCTGSRVNTEFMPKDRLNERGQVKVNDKLQLVNDPNCFAIGDCNDLPLPKLFALSGTKKGKMGMPIGQADTLFSNIYLAEQGKPLKTHPLLIPTKKAPKPMIMLPLGDKNAVTIGAPGFFGKMKSKHYFYPMQWQWANQKNKTPPMPKD